MIRSNYLASLRDVAPFWVSLLLIPLLVAVSQWGGWSILLVLAATWWLFPLLDQVFGRDPTNPDEAARLNPLFWSLITNSIILSNITFIYLVI